MTPLKAPSMLAGVTPSGSRLAGRSRLRWILGRSILAHQILAHQILAH